MITQATKTQDERYANQFYKISRKEQRDIGDRSSYYFRMPISLVRCAVMS